MGDERGRVLVHRDEDVVRIRVEGRGLAAVCPAVREFATTHLLGNARRIALELDACVYFDSTFAGTLLRLRKAIATSDEGELHIVAPGPEALGILRKMGLARLFTIVEDPLPPADWQPLADTRTEDRAFKENVVEAHRELADSSDEMAAIYGDIVEDVERELESTSDD